jgi:5-carboxymethyl-2-hydroxymuconate isomerase
MPHFIIEFSQGQADEAQVEALLDAVHRAAAESGLFEASHIRVRAMPLTFYRTAGGHEHFIHAQCRLHTGRDEARRHALSEAVLQALQQQRWPARSITVEVVEMERATYAKYVNHNKENSNDGI